MLYMVEQQWQLPNGTVAPIRSLVDCATEEEAQQGAPQAIQEALIVLAGRVIGEPASDPVVLYPIG